MAEQTPQQRIEWLQKQLEEAREKLTKAHQEGRATADEIRTEYARQLDGRMGERMRADRAEERLSIIRARLAQGDASGALTLANEWDIERKRRDRA